MLPLVVFVVVTGCARLVGHVAGLGAVDSWPGALVVGLAVMLVVTASAHFLRPQRDALAEMVPPRLGRPVSWVTVTGVLEAAGAVGLLVPATRPAAAVCVALLLLLMFPANVRAARHGVGISTVPLPVRALIQLVFVAACVVVV